MMHEFESAKESFRKLDNVYHTKSSCKPKGKPKGRKKNKIKAEVSVTKTIVMKKLKSKCFKCDQKEY